MEYEHFEVNEGDAILKDIKVLYKTRDISSEVIKLDFRYPKETMTRPEKLESMLESMEK